MLSLRFCLPPLSLNGLGNQFFCWAKAFTAAQELGATPLHPAWSRNPRAYRRLFRTMPFDWEAYRILTKCLPVFEFTESDYQAAGGGDYGTAIRVYAGNKGLFERRNYLLLTPGMWGGYAAIRNARHFIRAQLYAAFETPSHLYELCKHLRPGCLTVAVHIRRGDFSAPPEAETAKRGLLNTALPLDWYCRVCRELEDKFSETIQFLLFSDGTDSELQNFCSEFQPVRLPPHQHSEASDLLAMSQADLLICSASTFSLLGAFLSDSPYLWYAPQLAKEDGCYSLFNEGLTQRDARNCRMAPPQAAETTRFSFPRGIPITELGELPPALLGWLGWRLGLLDSRRDLILYGTVPCGGSRGAAVQ